MHKEFRQPRKQTVFVALMSVSAILSFCPPSWTNWMTGVMQPLAWVQHGLASVTRRGRETLQPSDDAARTSLELRLAADNEELRRQVLHQSALLVQLQQKLDAVSGIQSQLGEAHGRIILASVVAGDASPQRDSLTISRGAAQGVNVGDWVVAAAPRPEGVEVTGPALLRQHLIGRVTRTNPLTSQIALTTQIGFGPVRVRAARQRRDGEWELSGREALLYGGGSGKMQIRAASEDFLAQGCTRVVAPVGGTSTAVLLIGDLTGSAPVLNAPRHFDMTVAPLGDPRLLGEVYVLSLPK